MQIQDFIAKNKERKLRIAVIGDCMIDDYKYGNVDRVSPEFPVPILTSHKDDSEQCPGGAGNVCYQMKHFNTDVFLIGFLDAAAKVLYGRYQFDISRCVALMAGAVPRKIRFYDGDFPLHRWDVEQPSYGEDDDDLIWMREEAFSNFSNLQVDAVILSDYNKGFWTDELAQKIIAHCNANGILTVVDPKKSLARWKGCTIFKPNAKEAEKLSGLVDTDEEIDFLQSILGCKGVVITQSGYGVVGKYNDKHFTHWTPRKLTNREVNSVIGAGDCFAAIMTIALTHGFDLKESCAFAFEAGVQYVKARHNKPITLYDIHSRFDGPSAKIVTQEDLKYLKDKIYSESEFVWTNGCFDIIHLGHLETLRFAKSKGDKLIVGLNSDESIQKLKGPGRPIRTFEERAALMAGIEYVDFVVKFEEPTPEEAVKFLKPRYIVKGGDYSKDQVAGASHVKEVFIAPTIPGYSTTGFLERLNLSQMRPERPELT